MLAIYFKKQAEEYPIFQQVYEDLRAAGQTFPDPSARYIFKTIYSTAPPPRTKEPAYHAPSHPPNYITILTKQDKYAKLRRDLKLLIENLKLTNVLYSLHT